MAEPQPGADRPVDGSRPEPHRDGEPAVTHELPADPPGAADAAPEADAPRWSGSAPVPSAPPRRRGWGESAEPTPPPVPPAAQPEEQTPVDPWAGVDTSGWELPSTGFPALPPTLTYPAPPPTQPYAGPAAPVPPPPPHPAAPPFPVSPPAQQQPPGPPPTPARPVAPPPGWQAPAGYVPVTARRRRRWPWVLLFVLACCCGCPAYYGMPMASQYPANAALPAQVADLRLREDPRSARDARQLETQMRQAHLLADDTFAGIYHTSNGKRVTVFGGTGFRFSPSSDADAEIARLAKQYALGEVQVMETGVRGRHGRCAVGRTDGVGAVVCTSVDHGSITTGVFTGLSVDDSARLLGTLREQIVTTDG
ncbi:hypothetical protein [Micromonospora sp. WMMD1082]|uniref:hypothetical protein n=1 Tax=Micromonospora sp. WMMD1082 TaxID=3016104 RepID=UPI0024175E5F|nr:hypothetical protein [Micromonospora sp. WMMD1082]MDG4796105.1 hypothetical protein [Micromonospora sp. WMMD1082]